MPSTHPSKIKISDYTYSLPENKIANYPLPERDASKILVYKNGIIEETIYKNLAGLIPSGSLLVFNETKVIHARLNFKKPTGGAIEVFCLENDERYPDLNFAMQETQNVYWKCMVGGAAKWKENQELILEHALDNHTTLRIFALLEERRDQIFIIKFSWGIFADEEELNSVITFSEVLQIAGNLPLPPYIHRKVEESDEIRYQTIFARNEGSVAAPTAALHFTENLIEKIKANRIDTDLLTLHVGAGTFKPVKSEIIQDHEMHSEWISISRELIQNILSHKREGKKIIAVGTTSCRTLESIYWIGVKIIRKEWQIQKPMENIIQQWLPYEKNENISLTASLNAVISYLQEINKTHLTTTTQIMIAPGYQFRILDGLVTNFHQPQSTLLLLVSAFIGKDWKRVYNYALNNDFRFLSYGDGCLLWHDQDLETK